MGQGEGNATMATSTCERCGGSLVSITFDFEGGAADDALVLRGM